jgi:hypothetical protein
MRQFGHASQSLSSAFEALVIPEPELLKLERLRRQINIETRRFVLQIVFALGAAVRPWRAGCQRPFMRLGAPTARGRRLGRRNRRADREGVDMRSRRGGRGRIKLDGVERAHDDIAGPSGIRARFKARRKRRCFGRAAD